MGSAQKLSIYVNGAKATTSTFPNLKDWSTWSDKAEVLSLKAGENTITYKSDPGDGCINLDYIKVVPTTAAASPSAPAASAPQTTTAPAGRGTVYEAENATLAKGAWAATSHQGYSGAAYVEGFYNNIGAALTFKVKVAAAGKYNVTLHFSNSMGTEQKISIWVNGVKVANPSYPNLKDWSTWADKAEVLTLKAGDNTITYTSMTGDGCINFDYIRVAPAQ
jgi:hypothetical protein